MLTQKANLAVKSIQATKSQSTSSKRCNKINSQSEPEPKRLKLTNRLVDSLEVSGDLNDSEVNNNDEHKTTGPGRFFRRISLRNIRKQSCSKNNTSVDEEIMFVKEVQGDKNLI